MRKLLRPPIEALFRILFTFDCLGEEKLPKQGPAVVAANHPSYLDPILLALQVERPIRFMAAQFLFRVPLLGRVIRAFGAFPVDTRRGRGRAAYDKARELVEAGELVGIFPEGKRSRTGWMEPRLREGAARLAWETGAPLFPATIAGAYRAWPHFQSLPRPARIRVRYHEPIDPRPLAGLPEEQAVPALLEELRRRVDRSLLPGVKADRRTEELYHTPSPFPRFRESLPPLVLASVVFWQTRTLLWVIPAYAYLVYLLADHYLFAQSRLLKWLRNASPVLFLMAYAPLVLDVLGLPEVPAGAALAAMLCGALFPYLYERGRMALAFIRDLTLAFGFALLGLYLAPTGVGPHVSLPLFAAAFAFAGRTVFHVYATPVLAGYSIAAAWLLGTDGLLPHATMGLLAWLVGRFLPGGVVQSTTEELPEAGASLGLLDAEVGDEPRIVPAPVVSGGASVSPPAGGLGLLEADESDGAEPEGAPAVSPSQAKPSGGLIRLGLLDDLYGRSNDS